MRQNFHILFGYFFLTLILAACSSIGVSNNYDPAYAYSTLKTYSWVDNPNLNLRDPLTEKQFRQTMDNQLNEKGFVLQQSNPNFKIAYHSLDVNRKIELNNWGYGYGRWG